MTAPSIAGGIIERHARYGWSEPEGEWGHIHGGARQGLRKALDAGDTEVLDEILDTMFRNPVCLGMLSFDYRQMDTSEGLKALTQALSNSTATWLAFTDNADLRALQSPRVCHPVLGRVSGVSMMVDTPRHDYYARRIRALLPDGGTVLEIGGGYGGMARQLLQYSGDIRVVLCDLPETLYLAWHWLTRAGLSVAWFDEDPDADVCLLAAQSLEDCAQADLVFAAHSLSEMPLDTTRRYLEWIEAVGPRYFYHDSAHTKPPTDGGRTSDMFPETMAIDLIPGDPYHEVYRAPTLWDGWGSRYWEFLYERRS